MRAARRAADQPARGRGRAAIVGADVGEADARPRAAARSPARASAAPARASSGSTRSSSSSSATGAPPRWRKRKRAVLLGRVEGKGQRQRLERGARRHRPVDHVAVRPLAQRAACRRRRSPASARIAATSAVERRRAEPAGEPVAGLPVRPVAPHVGRGRKGRIGPRVPGPQMDARRARPCGRRRPCDTGLSASLRRSAGSNAPSTASR